MQIPGDETKFSLPDLDLCLVEGGDFLMGDNRGEDNNAKPVHLVRLSGFYIGKFPVTQQLWKEIMGDAPSHFKGKRHPVETISWNDAQVFIEKLNARQDVQAFIHQLNPSGTAFRLPTEAEWEYAARGGIYSQGYRYSGSDKLKQVGWYREDSESETKEVGLLLANELGIHDMSGNVFEWCNDFYDSGYYEECHKNGMVENPQGPSEGAGRVLRGGSSFDRQLLCRSVDRYHESPGDSNLYIGFRLVLPFQLTGNPDGFH